LHDHLNAEIVSQIIETKHDAIDWITWTFYYRRLTKNPNYYNLQGTTGDHINDHLSELLETTIEELEKAQCLTVEKDVALLPANIGRIASYYYIRYLTMQTFSKSLNEGRKLRALLDILSAANEFEEIPIRHGEEGLLRMLNEQVEYRIEGKEKLNEPASKANILFQCHFGRIPISADFATDQKYLLERAIRLMHGKKYCFNAL
jgi:pre-mRNA-splicing helicase BRR2